MRISWPMTGWRCITCHSAPSSLAGLSRIWSGMPILPMSCSGAASSMVSASSRSRPMRVGDEARVARHADQVVAGLLVAELAGAREAQQRLLLALAHLARRILDHVLEQAAAVLQRELLAAQRQQVAAARQALARVDRLGEEVGDAGVERGVAHLAVVVHRDHDDRHVLVARQRAQALHELDAVHVRHHVVDQHQVGDVARGPHHRVDRAREALDRDALVEAAHDLLEDGAAGRLVVDHHDRVARRRQHPHLRLGHAPPRVAN